MGEIEEVAETFNVVGNSNEHGLVIGESTFGGVSPLAWNQTGAIMDYGSLIYITLQRAKTVEDAIACMVDLMDTYGYASGGESFSLLDHSGQVWIMEVISRGAAYGKKGAVWVAQKIPDGAVAAHANQARITFIDWNDKTSFRYAEDVVDVAKFYGLFPDNGDDDSFSFSDVYDPVSFLEARQSEARVWSIFSAISDSTGEFQREYLDYALGRDISNRMPLYVTPYRKLSAQDVMHLMASHYEGTPLDSSVDVGAGLFESPYRPLLWFGNMTGWSFAAQVRPWMPAPLSAVLWFAADDSSTAPRVPIFGSSTAIPPPYEGKGAQDGVTTPLLRFDLNKAFWVQNMVSNFCYFRYKDIYLIVRQEIDRVQDALADMLGVADKTALTILNTAGMSDAVAFVTQFGVNTGNSMHTDWLAFHGRLFVQFRDLDTILPDSSDPVCGCRANEPGLSQNVMRRVVEETGAHYEVPPHDHTSRQGTLPRLGGSFRNTTV